MNLTPQEHRPAPHSIWEKLSALPSPQVAPEFKSFSDNVKDVVMIASSSRGGSSVFAEVLRKCDTFLHLRAEINPLLHVAGLTYPHSKTGSDALLAHHLTKEVKSILDRELVLESGNPHTGLLSPHQMEDYLLAITRRLLLQWPDYPFHFDQIRSYLLATWDILKKSYGWKEPAVTDPQLFWCVFLTQVRNQFPLINPYYYDLNPQLVAQHFPQVPMPEGPPGKNLIEEPPFIIPVPLVHPTAKEIASKPLVIKTPSNVYRWDFFRCLFPHATIWTLHLTRNAPSSINGLMDGWLHRGFFSHSMPGKFRIAGYSDRFPAWGADWWNFDLPPNWSEYVHRPLEEVCTFQWYEAHAAILRHHQQNPADKYLRIKVKEILSTSAEIRRSTADKIGHWLNLSAAGVDSLTQAMIEPTGPVMATQPPQKDRWRQRSAVILPLVRQKKITAMLEELGHEPNR